jgi:hypothetical protein
MFVISQKDQFEMKRIFTVAAIIFVIAAFQPSSAKAEPPWRALPLAKDGKVDAAWKQIGGGRFVVDDSTLRGESDETGMGMLLYSKEAFGNCQIRVIFRGKETKSNAGVFIRIDEGVLKIADSKEVRKKQSTEEEKVESEKELGPWYPVHRGFEVQISEIGDEQHRTGSIYSLAKAAPLPPLPADGWRTMVVTLKGNLIDVDVDGKRVCSFDSETPNLPDRKQYWEPKRENKRPQVGYIGLQNHGPNDVVWFKEVSVRPLSE